MALKPGDTLLNGHYHILRLVGHGGYGWVYQAQDSLLGEQVAIKELIPALVGDEAMLKRFLAEARATMRLTHKHIVRTHNVFQENHNYYIVMEYMAGGSLEERLRAYSSLPVSEAVRVAAEVCDGLACAHEEQVVHCDLKPANILFDASGRAKVADFGIAHVSAEMLTRSWHTPAGFVAGTLPYMSPEQTDGVRDEPRIDVYALGAVLYRMLTGRTYLDFDTHETPRAQAFNVARICDDAPRPPGEYNRDVPAWLDQVVLRALVKQPEGRFASIHAMRAALLQPQPARAPAASPPPPAAQRPPAQPVASATPVPPRPAESGPAAGERPAAVKRAPLPRWFWPAAAGAAVLLVVLVIAIGAVLMTGSGTETPVSPSSPTAMPVALAPKTRSADGATMVYVPAGEFPMGTGGAAEDELPVHTVALDAFWIDQTEVTNAQYRLCVKTGDCTVPPNYGSYSHRSYFGNPEFNDYPVLSVEWSQAEAYCRWAGARLPTEAEWEKAARGTDGRMYPWGNQAPDCELANYTDREGVCVGDTSPVGSCPAGASPYGALDMAGNVWEWVADWYDADYYAISPASNPAGPATGVSRVLRGGGWSSRSLYVRATGRGIFGLAARGVHVGFRCAASGD